MSVALTVSYLSLEVLLFLDKLKIVGCSQNASFTFVVLQFNFNLLSKIELTLCNMVEEFRIYLQQEL